MAKKSMSHQEKAETPKMESQYHSAGFLSKALAHKKGLSKGSKQFKKG